MPDAQITYNPGVLGDAQLIRSFVVRQESLGLVLEALRDNAASQGVNRHMLIVGPRGSGKTMLVRRAAAEIRSNAAYGAHWFPVVFGEESYPVSTSGEFWLEALFHLADQTKDAEREKTYLELRNERDDARLRERALGQLLDYADGVGKRLVLVVENLNMLVAEQMDDQAAWDLRHTLMNEPRLMLLGTATSRFDEITDAGRAWFEMFSVHDLRPLEPVECATLWQAVTTKPLEAGPLRAIRILTGGNPRLLTVMASFAANRSFRELMEHLVHLIDDHTEYFKSHLDALSAKERKVFVALLEHWDPVGAAELAAISRLQVNETSTMLGRLVDRGAVEVAEQQGRKKFYQVAERLYNIYYLMRRRGEPAGRVRIAVRFMVTFYEGEELAARAAELAREACGLPPGTREELYLAYAELVGRSSALAPRILRQTPAEFFAAEDAPDFIRPLEHDKSLDQAGELLKAGELAQAEERFRRVLAEDLQNPLAWSGLAELLFKSARWQEAEKAARKAVDLMPDQAALHSNLGAALSHLRRQAEAREELEIAVKLQPNLAVAWFNLGHTEWELSRRDEARQAYETAVKLDPATALYWRPLGHLLLELAPAEEAERFWREALKRHPRLADCAVHVLQLRLQQGADGAAVLREAEEWVERTRDNTVAMACLAQFVVDSRLSEGFEEAEDWAREAAAKDPTWCVAGRLAHVLIARGKWDEMFEVSRPIVDAAATEESAQENATDLLIRAAAAGHVREALEALTNSKGAAALEPLAVGLRIYAGEKPLVAKELLEVGQDVAERIRMCESKPK